VNPASDPSAWTVARKTVFTDSVTAPPPVSLTVKPAPPIT